MLRSLRLMAVAWFGTLWGRLTNHRRYPSWSFVFELMIRYLRLDWDETADWDDMRLREDLNRRPYPRQFANKVKLESGQLGNVAIFRFIPPNSKAGYRLLFLHGGSYIYGSSATTHAELIARLAVETGIEAIGVEYRLVPENTYPTQLNDAVTTFDALVASGVSAQQIIVAGDSAGGNLAIALQIALRDRGGPQAVATVLSSPWVNLLMPGASFTENEPFDYGTRDVLEKQARKFAGDFPLSDPRISPCFADLVGLAPCFITLGELEIPRDDILQFSESLKRAGVEVTLHRTKDMPHNPPVFAAFHPEAKAAFDSMVQFIRSKVA